MVYSAVLCYMYVQKCRPLSRRFLAALKRDMQHHLPLIY